MIVELKFTKSQIDRLLDEMIIVCDTREQRNEAILQYFKDKNINYKIEKLEVGDYGIMLKANPDLGLHSDVYLNNVAIERKNSLDEICQNVSADRTRLENEFLRKGNTKLYMMIENSKYSDIITHNYRSKMSPQALLGNIKSFEAKHDLNVVFLDNKKYSGNFIAFTLKHHLRNYLKAS